MSDIIGKEKLQQSLVETRKIKFTEDSLHNNIYNLGNKREDNTKNKSLTID